MTSLGVAIKIRTAFFLSVMLYFIIGAGVHPLVLLGLTAGMILLGTDSRIPAYASIAFIVVAMALLCCGFGVRAETWTIHAFYFVCVSVLLNVVDIARNDKKENEKIR